MRRYTDRPFPAYRFVPGRAPHPTRDPEGHSYGEQPAALTSFDAGRWSGCEEYLYGIDLFNHRYWWEAHEALEAVWVAAGRRSATGLFVQGLIQIAVAHLKRLQGFDDTAGRMARAGLEKMRGVEGVYLGIDVRRFRAAVDAYFSGEADAPVTISLEGPGLEPGP